MLFPYKENEWQIWFAWHPVPTKEGMVWLEKVRRKIDYSYAGMGDYKYERTLI